MSATQSCWQVNLCSKIGCLCDCSATCPLLGIGAPQDVAATRVFLLNCRGLFLKSLGIGLEGFPPARHHVGAWALRIMNLAIYLINKGLSYAAKPPLEVAYGLLVLGLGHLLTYSSGCCGVIKGVGD